MYQPGDVFYKEYVFTNTSGVPCNADFLPHGTFFKNGVDDSNVNVFTSNIDAGRYVSSGIIPNTYLPGYSIGLSISGYIGGLYQKGVFDLDQLQRPVTVSSGGLDNIIIDGNTNFRQAVSIMASAIAGSSTVNGNNIIYYSLNNNTIQRVLATAVSGARQSVVLYLP